MELVYLWVEEYKNIHQQGFNFSGRYRCDYDLENNELTIDEKKDYVHVFPENINVTAIVGENGSGKSSLLELLLMIENNRWQNLKSFFYIYKMGDTLFAIKHDITIKKTPKNLIAYNIGFPSSYKTFWINYKNSSKQRNNLMLKSIVGKQSIYNTGSQNEYFISKHIHVYNHYKEILAHLKNKYLFNMFQVKFKLKNTLKVNEDFNLHEIYNKIIIKFYPSDENIFNIFSNTKPFSSVSHQLAYNCFIAYVQFYLEYQEQISNAEITKFFEASLHNIRKRLSFNNACEVVFNEMNIFNNLLQQYSHNIENFASSFDNILKNLLYLQKNESSFMLSGDYYIFNIDLQKSEEINSFVAQTQYLSDLINVDEYIFNFIDYDFINIDTDVTYYHLSDGEREILNICVDLIHHISLHSNKEQLIIADEIDNSLHPKWKKEIFSILIKIFDQFKEIYGQINFHFITTTHSPFILSDIPKENVIFLENGEQKYPFKDNEQTFGANIHTLLSHGFFMNDGLMGEFAKSKINKIIEFHKQVEEENQKEKKDFTDLQAQYENQKTQFWHIQKIIGEEYLKQVIKNHLIEIEKILLGKDEAKNAEIARVEVYLASLEND
ncbi:MAG: AAA family ATPase [Sulfuricurvum sp.]